MPFIFRLSSQIDYPFVKVTFVMCPCILKAHVLRMFFNVPFLYQTPTFTYRCKQNYFRSAVYISPNSNERSK